MKLKHENNHSIIIIINLLLFLKLTNCNNELESINEIKSNWNNSTTENHDKPTKFDLDVTHFIQTDDKQLYNIENNNNNKLENSKNKCVSLECLERRFKDLLKSDYFNYFDKIKIFKKNSDFNNSRTDFLKNNNSEISNVNKKISFFSKDLVKKEESRTFFGCKLFHIFYLSVFFRTHCKIT